MRFNSARAFAASLAVWAVLSLPAAAQPARETSLSRVPADAAFYSTSLRLGEQMKLFLGSRAFAKLRSLPAVQFAWQQFIKEAHKPGNPWDHVFKFLHAPENAELHELLHDVWKEEVFVYGGADSVEFLQLMMEISGATRFAPLMAQMQGVRPEQAQLNALIDSLKETKHLSVPNFVVGFRTTKGDAANNQLKRLEAVIRKEMDKHEHLKGRVKPFDEAGAKGFRVEFDGTVFPWDEINWDDVGDKKEELKELVEKVKKLKFVGTFAVKGQHLLISFGKDSSAIARFGGDGPNLAGRPEMAPLGKFANERLVSINYVSEAFMAAVGTKPEDVKELGAKAREALKQSPISEKLQDNIAKDIDALLKEVAESLPKPHASMGFSFMTSTGVEGYNYAYDKDPGPKQPLTILGHRGESPVLFVAGRDRDATPYYKHLVQWIQRFYGHADAVVTELAGEAQAEQFRAGVQQVMPFLKRFDDLTGNMFLPALAEGQNALVLDSKWKSKNWFPELDQKGQELPMLEVGLEFGVSNAELLVKAFKGYRELVNDVLVQARNFGAGIPEDGWPAPKTQKAGPATLYYWPLPQAGQDPQIMPNIGVSDKLLTFTLSATHAERLHRGGSPNAAIEKLAGGKTVSAAAGINFEALIAATKPWVDTFGVPALQEAADDNAPVGLRKADIAPQVAAAIDILSTLKSMMMVTYRDGNATVTHSQLTVKDIP